MADALQEQLNTLPQELRSYVLSEDAQGKTKYAAEVNGLMGEQADLFEEEVFITLIGSSKPENLASNLIEDGINPDIAQKLSSEAHSTIFAPVKVHLDELYKDETSQPVGISGEAIKAPTIEAPSNLPTESKTNKISIKKEVSTPVPTSRAKQDIPSTPKTETSSDLEQTLADLDTILKPDPASKPNWLHKEVGEKQKILHDLEVPPPPDKKEKSVFEKKLDENLYKKDAKKKPSDDPTSSDEAHKKINSDPYREPIP